MSSMKLYNVGWFRNIDNAISAANDKMDNLPDGGTAFSAQVISAVIPVGGSTQFSVVISYWPTPPAGYIVSELGAVVGESTGNYSSADFETVVGEVPV